jgi:hypothetical protein
MLKRCTVGPDGSATGWLAGEDGWADADGALILISEVC